MRKGGIKKNIVSSHHIDLGPLDQIIDVPNEEQSSLDKSNLANN